MLKIKNWIIIYVGILQGLLIGQNPHDGRIPYFAVIVCSYNNERWCTMNLESLFMQRYPYYHIYYCDDASTDATLERVKNIISNLKMEDRITIIANRERQYKLYNLYTIIHTYLPNDVIVVEVDGDDWLVDDDVLDYLAELYSKEKVWMTYGGFVAWPYAFSYLTPLFIPDYIVKNNNFRSFYHKGSIFMALRTFYAGLFKKIKKKDLSDNQGNFFTCSSDILTMIPMFEMSAQHFHFVDKICYCYNTDTGNNDYTHQKKLQYMLYNRVRSQRKYQGITTYK